MLNKAVSFWLFFIVYLGGINITENCQAIPQVISEPENAINSSNLEVIDYWTQHFFDLLRPEQKGKEVQRYETHYQREKAAIAQVVTHVLFSTCQQSHRNHYFFLTDQTIDNDSARYSHDRYLSRSPNHRSLSNRERKRQFNFAQQRRFILEKEHLWENDFYWRQNRNYFFEGLYRDLTDAIFYARHPEISLKEDKSRHLNWGSEWNFIRRRFANYDQEKVLKHTFIPVCHDFQE